MAQQAVTQLIVDSSGARIGVAEFEALMGRAKKAAIDGGNVTASSFETAQRKWTQSLGATNPVIKAQIAMERDLARQRNINTEAVKLGIATQAAADAQLERVRQRHLGLIAATTQSGRAIQAANDNMRGYASSLGPVGSLLMGLGPAGLVAGAGIAVVSLGVAKLVTEVNALADRSGKMVDFSESTGLSTTALQALVKAGAAVGIEADKIGSGFERFSTQLDELRRGSGGLYDALNRIDPLLTREMATTRDAAEAWDVLNKARERAATLDQKNALSKAVFGKGGVGMGRLQDASIDAGGMGGLIGQLREVSVLTTEQMKRWDDMKDRSDYAAKAARDNFASIFAEPVLQGQVSFYETLEKISGAAKGFTISDDLKAYLRFATAPLRAAGNLLMDPWHYNKDTPGVTPGTSVPSVPAPKSLADTFSDRFGASKGSLKPLPEFQAAELQKQIAAMGDAATAADKLKLAQMQLAISGKEAGLSAAQLAAASGALNEAFASQALQARIGLLGQDASALDIVRAKQFQINAAVRQGAQFTKDETAAILSKARAMHEAQQLGNQLQFERDQMGRDPIEQEVAARMRAEWGADYAKHMNDAEASMIRQNAQMREMSDMMKEAGSSFLSSLMQGQSLSKSIGGALAGIGNKAAQQGMNRLMTNPSTFFGNQSLMSGQGAMGMLGAGAAGYQSASPLAGALGGAMAGSAFGPAGAVVGAIIGGVSGFLGRSAKKRQEEQDAQEAADRVRHQDDVSSGQRQQSYVLRANLAGLDTSKKEGALKAFDLSAEQARLDEQRAGGRAMAGLEQALAAERLRIIDEFAKAAAESEKARRREYSDRLFAAVTDMTKLENILAGFDREAAYQREAELKAGNEAIADLELVLAAERMNIITNFNAAALEEEKRTKDLMIGYAKQINEYLLGLKTGALSTLSPADQVAASRSAYETKLGLAQGGDQDAMQAITGVAQAYLEQLRSFYGPSTVYGDLFAQITGQLSALASGITGGMRYGGIVGAFAGGGMVGNGMWNVDSVRARYAGGGDIALAGGEHVTRATSVNPMTMPVLDSINRTGRAPGNDNGPLIAEVRSLRRDLTSAMNMLARLQSDGNQGTAAVKQSVDNLRTDVSLKSDEARLRKAS